MDFSADEPVKINYLNPATAVTNNNETKIAQLSARDKDYTALKEEESINIGFDKAAETTGRSNALFLLTTGYYHSKKRYTGKTQTATLYQFRKKGAFNEYSIMKNKYAQEALARGINLQSEKNDR